MYLQATVTRQISSNLNTFYSKHSHGKPLTHPSMHHGYTCIRYKGSPKSIITQPFTLLLGDVLFMIQISIKLKKRLTMMDNKIKENMVVSNPMFISSILMVNIQM